MAWSEPGRQQTSIQPKHPTMEIMNNKDLFIFQFFFTLISSSLLPMNRGAWQAAYSPWGHEELDTSEQFSP